MSAVVRWETEGVKREGIVVAQEKDPTTGRWIYEIEPLTALPEGSWEPSKLHFSEFEVVQPESPIDART